MGGNTALEQRKGGTRRDLLLRDQSMARGRNAASSPRCDLRLGGLCRPLPGRHASRRHRFNVPEALASDAGENRPARRRRARQEEPRHRRAGVWSGNAARGGTGTQCDAAVGRTRWPPIRRRLLQGALSRLEQGEGAASLLRQLGRQRTAPARQCRRLCARCFGAKMARASRRHALGRCSTPTMRMHYRSGSSITS